MDGENGKRENRDGEDAMDRFITRNQVSKAGCNDEDHRPQQAMDKA